ncbi:unnamed protein product [Amoebophrya sp. A25]|nr:unnamed protein product [Amoebophrya sp. A25]|eukprot:GSA25T00008843001.1
MASFHQLTSNGIDKLPKRSSENGMATWCCIHLFLWLPLPRLPNQNRNTT